jgi:hypothetical protein
MGRFDSFTPEERGLLLHLLITYLDKASPGDKYRELGQALLKEIPPAAGHEVVMQIVGVAPKKARKRAGYKSAEQVAKKLKLKPPISGEKRPPIWKR